MKTNMISSGVLTWNQESIKNAPTSTGVFVLRNSPINGFILVMDRSDNLKEALEDIYLSSPYADVRFFEWYQAESSEDVEKIFAELKSKYHVESSE